jgi:HK97 gp10 family phage protein
VPATLKSRLPMITAQLRPRVSAAVKEAAETIAVGAKERVHVDSGDLRDSIHVERTGAAEYSVIAGDENVFYGHLEEFGTSHSPPHPFLVPAAEAGRSVAAGLVTAALRGL